MPEKDPTRPEADEVSSKKAEPAPDGPKEVEDAARQESEYPADETNEG